eukprot:3574593-Pleurochrysis_carterae.AAC.1
MLLGLKWRAVTSSAFTEHRAGRSDEEKTCLHAPWTTSVSSPASGVASGILALQLKGAIFHRSGSLW